MKYYYAGPDNKTTGPVTLDEIQTLIKNGTLKSDPMVVPEGSTDWKPLSAHTGQAPAGGPPPPPPPAGSHQAALAAEKAKEASKDALAAFKTLATSPVVGMAPAFNGLGPARAMGAGIAFGVVSALLLVFVSYRMTSGYEHNAGFFFKSLLASLVPFVSLVAATFGARMVFGGQGGINHDCFVAGASMLPLVLVFLVTFILGPQNYQIIGVCFIFGICLTVLMLFAGLTRISGISEKAATFAVPCVVLISIVLSKVLENAIMGGGSGMGMGGGFPGMPSM
jgi:hypothetical protein